VEVFPLPWCCSGDNRTGEGGGDDETITVKLSKLQSNVRYVAFLINVFNAQNLSAVKSCTARVYHGSKKAKFKNATLMEFPISKSDEFDSCRGLFMFFLVRNDAWWSVHAVAAPAQCVLADVPCCSARCVAVCQPVYLCAEAAALWIQ
jgi:stress response protein SCP2